MIYEQCTSEKTITSKLKQLDGGRMARGRSESTVPRNQRSSELFGQDNVGSIVGRKIVAQLPNPGEEHQMRIPSNAKIQQIAHRLVSTVYGDHPLPCQTP